MSDLYEHDATTNTLPFLARSGAPDEGGDIRVSSLGSRCAQHHLCVHGGLDPADLDKLNAVSRGSAQLGEVRPCIVWETRPESYAVRQARSSPWSCTVMAGNT